MDEGVYYFKVGAKKDGTITAVKGRAVLSNQWFPVFGFTSPLLRKYEDPSCLWKSRSGTNQSRD